jgi:hypothetical protein
MANLKKKNTLAAKDWEIINHPPYSPNLALGDFNLSSSMKLHLGGQNFRTYNELKHSVLKSLMQLASVTCQDERKKQGVSVKEYEFGSLDMYILFSLSLLCLCVACH